MNILIIDNYDSFTYNLYQYTGEILKGIGDSFAVDVFRNDAITIEEIKKRKYDKIIISPGPGDSADRAYFGVCAKVLTDIGKTTPVLGVCLGMQGMAYYFGGRVKRALEPMHGKTSLIAHDGKGIFKNIPQDIEVMRYHSLIADRETLPDCLEITAVVPHPIPLPGRERALGEGEVMGLRHKTYPIEGIQFHPESFATEAGRQMLTNFLLKND